MRPWAHESELARHLDVQRSIARERTPSTPTFPNPALSVPDEELQRLEEIATALNTFKDRLYNNEELVDYTGRVLDFVNQLRQDLPITTPENAFTQLQPLRDLIFWLPSAVLHAEESDLGALILLSHLYAIALAVDQIFPEIGGSYLGSMCLLPADRIHDILRNRRNSQPQDSAYQVALALVEIPMQITGAYKQRQRSIGGGEGYRASRQPSPYIGSQMQMIPSQEHAAALYSNSPVHTPQIPGVPVASFYPPSTGGMSGRRDSPSFRQQMMAEKSRSMGNPLSAMQMYGGQQQYSPPQTQSSHESGGRMDYFGQGQQARAPYQYYGGMDSHTRFVTSPQLWT